MSAEFLVPAGLRPGLAGDGGERGGEHNVAVVGEAPLVHRGDGVYHYGYNGGNDDRLWNDVWLTASG